MPELDTDSDSDVSDDTYGAVSEWSKEPDCRSGVRQFESGSSRYFVRRGNFNYQDWDAQMMDFIRQPDLRRQVISSVGRALS